MSPPPSSLCLPLWGVLASLLLVPLEQQSCLTLHCHAATPLPRFPRLPFALRSPFLDNHWQVCKRQLQRRHEGREKERSEGSSFNCCILQFVFPRLHFPGILEYSDCSGESSLKEFILLSLRFPPLFISGTECRGGEKREGLRGLQTQLHSLVSHLAPHTQTPDTYLQTGLRLTRLGGGDRRQKDRQLHRQTHLSWRQWTAPVGMFLVG